MSISLVQSAINSNSIFDSTHVSCSWPSSTGSARWLLMSVSATSIAGGSTITFTTPSGWTLLDTVNNGTSVSAAFFYIENSGSRSGSETVSLSAGSYASMTLAEYSGVATSSSIDQHTTNSGTSANGDSGSVTTTNANDGIAALIAYEDATAYTTPGSPTNSFTIEQQTSTGSTPLDTLFLDRIVSSTGTYSTSTSTNRSVAWVGLIVAFKSSASAITPGAGSLTFAGAQVTANITQSIAPSAGALALTGAPVSMNRITAGSGSLTIAGVLATVVGTGFVSKGIGAGALTLTGVTPSTTAGGVSNYSITYAKGYQQTTTNDAAPYLDNDILISFADSLSVALTLEIDFGTPTAITAMHGVIGYANSHTDAWDYSDDGSTWHSLSVTAGLSYPSGSGSYASLFQYWTVDAGTSTHRFFRYSVQDDGSGVAQVAVGRLTPGGAAGGVNVWCQGYVGLDFDHIETVVSHNQPCDSSADGHTDYAFSSVSLQYISGGTGHLAQMESQVASAANGYQGANLYEWVTLWDYATFSDMKAYVGYFPQRGSDLYLAELFGGTTFQAYNAVDGLVTYTGWKSAGAVGTVPSKAIGATFKVKATRVRKSYSNVTMPSGYVCDITYVTEFYVGYVTLGAFVIPVCPAKTTTSITPQGWGDFKIPDNRNGPYPHDLGFRTSIAPRPRASWWEIPFEGATTLYDDSNPQGTLHEAWDVSAASLTNLDIYVPCDFALSTGKEGPFCVGASLRNFDTSGNDVTAMVQHDFTTDGPYIYPDSYGNLGVFGVFRVEGGTACTVSTPPDTAEDHALLSADTFDGALNVLWVSGGWPGNLKHAVHMHPSLQIGSSATGWQATQTIENSGDIYECGLVYLPEGRIYINYNKNGHKEQRYNDQRGTGNASDWSAAANADQGHLSAANRGQEQAWRFIAGANSSAGDITFSQCRDGKGSAWTSSVTSVSGTARGPLCGGIFTGNQYGLLYTNHADSHVKYLKTGNPSSWGGTPVDTGVTGNVCGLCRHDSGRLVGVVQASAGGACSAIYSSDNGATWISVSISITPTPPPVIVHDAGTIYIVYIDTDAPHFIASKDAGATWA